VAGEALDGVVLPPDALQAVIRAVAQAFGVPRPPAEQDAADDLPPLLGPGQAAKLLGVSRNTMDRMIADGQVPSVVLREGPRQRMVRVPKAFIVGLLKDLNSGVRVHLEDYTARWLESVAAPPAAPAAEPAAAGREVA
jgi:excisionase family DNA binding protein